MSRIGFLHTAAAHADTFERLVSARNPDVAVCHEVQPGLLASMLEAGVTDGLLQGINAALGRLAAEGCEAMACTCSTLGEIVEGRVVEGVRVQRIDRAAAELAVRQRRLLVLVALESAGEAAERLLASAETDAGVSCRRTIVLLYPVHGHISKQGGRLTMRRCSLTTLAGSGMPTMRCCWPRLR